MVLFHCTERKRSSETERWKETKKENRERHSERAREISLHRAWMQEFVCKSTLHVSAWRVKQSRNVCVSAYISVLHLSNGFGQVGGYFCQSFSSAVHNVVTAGAGLWAL